MNTQTPQPPNSSMWMGDLLWKPQQHAIRMETRWPQLLKQNKLSSDSTATRNRGEDTNATAALNEGGSTTTAQNLGKDTHAAAAFNPSENTSAAATKEKAKKKEVMSRSQEKMKRPRKETVRSEDSFRERRQTPTERIEQEDQKMHQRGTKNKTTRKDTTDSGRIQRHQKYIMRKIWKGRERSSRM